MTVEIPILGSSLLFDVGVYVEAIDSAITLTNPKLQTGIYMPFPTAGDLGLEVTFPVPQNYSADPVLVLRGILVGSPSGNMAWGAQQLSIGDSGAVDTAYETEDLGANSTWTGYATEDMYEETIVLTPASAYTPGDTIFLRLYRDDSADTTTFDFLLLDLSFRYTEV